MTLEEETEKYWVLSTLARRKKSPLVGPGVDNFATEIRQPKIQARVLELQTTVLKETGS